ncbi:MAG TPA: type IV pilus assembly protein PilM [Gemmatimonadales bacterium]
MALFGLGGSKTTVGLDIGSGLIKLAAIEHDKGEAVLKKVAIAPVLADAIVEGEIMDPGVVADAIRGLLQTAGIKQKKVVVAVGGRDVIIKKIPVDRMKESEAFEVVRWEAQQHVPFDIEGVALDFQVLDPDAEGVQMDVMLVAAKRELVENRTALLSEAGLDAAIVDVDSFALHNAFEVNYPEAMQGTIALIHIGHEVTNINILQNGVPVLTRDLSVGTRRFREDLQREKGMGSDDADRTLQGFERTAELDPHVAMRGEEIAVGVERAAAFLQSASREAGTIERAYCSGGGARIPGLADVLSSRLRIPVEVADPMKGIRVGEDAFGALNVDEVAPLLMLAIGLALRKTN